MTEKILSIISQNFELTEKEQHLVQEAVSCEGMNLPRLQSVIEKMVEYHTGTEPLVAYVVFKHSQIDGKILEDIEKKLTPSEHNLFHICVALSDLRFLTKSGEAESVRRMIVAICQDMRMIIVKFATMLYDLQLIENPMSSQEKEYAQMISDIFAPLAERLGLSKFKNAFEDLTFKLLEPDVFLELKNDALLKYEDNQKQFKITGKKLQKILTDLNITGEIHSRQKHFSSIYKKLVRQNITLSNVYDLLAMRVIVPTVDDCYAVFGQIHAIYKPIDFRVKDFIANPRPNGYQSLHTTIIAENNRPLEIQIRTFDMHRECEYGVAAHWIYKDNNSRAFDKFNEKLTWFRQVVENTTDMSSEEFLETLKTDLYGESIFVQTPKGKVLEFPSGSTMIDFAFAVHTDVGRNCVGGKINGKIMPITTKLSNGDIVEILTNPNSKGPSRDWLKYVKTSGARSRIRAFFKTQLKDENIKIGKSMLEQALKNRLSNLTKDEKEKYLLSIAKSMVMENLDTLYAEIGAGSLPAQNVVGRLVNLYKKDQVLKLKNTSIHVKKNKDGVLVDGDTGLLVRYALCCKPVVGDDIVGYISSGRGVTIHRANCLNLKYLEKERLVDAQWSADATSQFLVVIKVETENKADVVNNLNNIARSFKNSLKGFGYKQTDVGLEFEIAVMLNNKTEIEHVMKSFENLKCVQKVTRSS